MADYDTIAVFMTTTNNQPIPTKFGERIQAKLGDMSLRDAERQSGISKDTIRRAITNTLAEIEVTIKFCLWLNCDLETALNELGFAEKLELNGKLKLTERRYLKVA